MLRFENARKLLLRTYLTKLHTFENDTETQQTIKTLSLIKQ